MNDKILLTVEEKLKQMINEVENMTSKEYNTFYDRTMKNLDKNN